MRHLVNILCITGILLSNDVYLLYTEREMDEKQPLLRNSNSSQYQGTSSDGDAIILDHSTGASGCHVLAAEFRLRNLLLTHSREDVFYSCQWDWPPLLFVLYRVIIAIYAFTVIILSIVFYDEKKWSHYPWPVWLTNWSFFILTAHLMLSAAIVVLYSLERGRCFQRWSLRSSVYSFLPDTDLGATASAIPPASMPWFIKLDWLVFNVAACAAILVTIVFFSAIYPRLNPNGGLNFGDATIHMSNSIIVLIEFCVCAIPIRLLHGLYTLIYGLIYMIFSIIYWAIDHNHVLYPKVLDWNHPLMTSLVVVLLAVVGIPFIQLTFFTIYRGRLAFYKYIYGSFSSY